MDKIKAKIIKGDRVQRLLDDQDVQEALTAVEAELHAMWASTKSEDQAKREELYRELHGLSALKARLQRFVNDGIKARQELN